MRGGGLGTSFPKGKPGTGKATPGWCAGLAAWPEHQDPGWACWSSGPGAGTQAARGSSPLLDPGLPTGSKSGGWGWGWSAEFLPTWAFCVLLEPTDVLLSTKHSLQGAGTPLGLLQKPGFHAFGLHEPGQSPAGEAKDVCPLQRHALDNAAATTRTLDMTAEDPGPGFPQLHPLNIQNTQVGGVATAMPPACGCATKESPKWAPITVHGEEGHLSGPHAGCEPLFTRRT